MCLKCCSTMSDTKPYCFSKPQTTARATATATLGSSTVLPPWSNLYIYARTELDESHIIIASWCQLCEYFCCRDPVSRLLPVLSHRPVLRNIFVVKILSYFVPASLTDCTAESRIWTSVIGRRGSKAFLLALHNKDKSFFINSRTIGMPRTKTVR